LRRTAAFALDLDLETAADLPPSSWAIVQSPNDPTGTLLDPLDAVRLARACEVLVIDERHGAYAGRSLLPLVREFDNIVLLQTMETWAGLRSFPVAFAVAPPTVLARIGANLACDEISAGSMTAAIATLGDLAHVQLTVRRVRQERSRLYRMLRKLNMVTPGPSWGNFLPVRVERGSATGIVSGLAERGIWVHKPPHPELATLLRISAGFPEHTDALKRALIEIGRDL
jgi:histidinol-phosphate aminotransferase